MLVLSRQPGESLIIDDHICITIASIKKKQVKLAITAPPEIPIYRQELYDKITAGRKADDDQKH